MEEEERTENGELYIELPTLDDKQYSGLFEDD